MSFQKLVRKLSYQEIIFRRNALLKAHKMALLINYMNLYKFIFNLFKNLVNIFNTLLLLSFKFIDRLNIFCNNIIINPIPNSTADKIKKKNVNEIIASLSQILPTINESA
jgi:hypothetical protein